MVLNTSKTVPFVVANAFTKDAFGGNPAAIVFLDSDLPAEALLNIAKKFNQPMTTFLLPFETASEETSRSYHVCWFTPGRESAVCGHGTLAAAGTIFSLGLVPPSVRTLHFVSSTNGMQLSARKDGDLIEITLDATHPQPLLPEEEEKLKGVVRRALRSPNVTVKFLGRGGTGFEHQLLVEIDEKDGLADCKVDTSVFLETGYSINIVTCSSSKGDAIFYSRMFAPDHNLPEDHVCGSAHSILTPYWDRKTGSGGAEMLAKQVSERGGDLRVTWLKDENRVALKGETVTTMKGELYI